MSRENNVIKLILLLGLASILSYIIVYPSLQFYTPRCNEGCWFPFVYIIVAIFSILQPILSVIPKFLFSLTELFPLEWPFVIAGMIVKYSLILITIGFPFFLTYFWARRIISFDRKKLKIIFTIIFILSIAFVINHRSYSLESDRNVISTAKKMAKICQGDKVCEEVLYSKVLKNGQFYNLDENNVRKEVSGFRMPSIASLKNKELQQAFLSLPNKFRESYCENVYGPKGINLNICRGKLSLIDINSPSVEDCYVHSISDSQQLAILIKSCNEKLHIKPIDEVKFSTFLKSFKYQNKWNEMEDVYEFVYPKTIIEFDYVILDNNTLALSSGLNQNDQVHANFHITQTDPGLFDKYASGAWSPTSNEDLSEKAVQISLEQNTILGHKIVKQHLNIAQLAEGDTYRIGFVIKNNFIIVEARGDNYMNTNEIYELAEKLAERVITFMSSN